MKKQIEIYISELLFLHDCVIVPGFGGFVGNKKSSFLNEITNTILPPSKEILFNKNLTTNDGLLISYISNSEQISNEEAKSLIDDFVREIDSKLIESKTCRIDKIGLFSINSDGNILFLQDSSANYNIDSFGMKTQKTSKINHVEEKIKEIVNPSSKKNGDRKIWRAAAILIPIIGISLISITQEEKINDLYSQMANLNPFPIFEDNEENKSSEIKIEEEVRISEEEEVVEEIIEKRFFVIAGSFSHQKNAERLVNQLKSENYNSSIIGKSKEGLIRVCYDGFSTKEEATSALIDLKSDKKTGWILSL